MYLHILYMYSFRAFLKRGFSVTYIVQISLVPRLPNLFKCSWEKEGEPGIQSQVTNVNVMKERRSTTVDFESLHQLQFITHSSLRPSHILLNSLKVFGTISSVHVELEHLKICIARPQSIITTRHPSYLCIWGDICHVRLDLRHPLFLVYIEEIGEARDEASVDIKCCECSFQYCCVHLHYAGVVSNGGGAW